LYADDVALFLKLDALLKLFGDASGLSCNFNKCAIAPIACSNIDVPQLMPSFPCQLVDFPCKYFGLPLSLKNLTKG
jgi:hypothetical protein